MQILKSVEGLSNVVFYEEGMRNLFSIHRGYFLTNQLYATMEVEQSIAYRYENDFYGLCTYLKIPKHLHWYAMRLLDFLSPMDPDRDLKVVLVPDNGTLEQLRMRYENEK